MGYPSYVEMADGGEVENKYTSGGTRLESRRMAADSTVTTMSYEGNEVFENGNLRMLLFDGGYMDFSGSESRYCWYTKDHLGSVRAVSDSEGTVFSTYAYGPYGEDFAVEEPAEINQGGLASIGYDGVIPDLEHISVYPGEMSQYSGISGPINGNGGSNQPTAPHSVAADSDWQPYKFSGKESLTRVGLDLYDFGARMYSPSNMHWMTMDPLAEKYYHISPCVYCAGNPVNLVDPDGRMVGDYYNTSGVYIGTNGIDDGMRYLVLDDAEVKAVKKTNKEGKTTSTSDVKSAISVPSNEVIGTAEEALKQSKTNEHGFVVATDGTTSSIIAGTKNSVQLGPGYIELENNGKETSFDVHIHPFEYSVVDGMAKYNNSEPSDPADITYRRLKEYNNEVNQPSWIIGESPKDIHNLPATGTPDYHKHFIL